MFELFDIYEQCGEDKMIANALRKGMTPTEVSEVLDVSIERVYAVQNKMSEQLQPV